MSGQWFQTVGQWEEFENGLAATQDSGATDAVKDSAKGNQDEQKQPNRDEQQPLHALV